MTSNPTSEYNEATARPNWIGALLCAALTMAILAPFANEAFHIDDTLFLYAARQICAHPADPFGFKVNWYGTAMPMAEVTQNPPLTSYYMALVASCFGWSEIAQHLAVLVPAVAAVLGTYFLAVRFCKGPLLAALATLLCPVFMVSSATVMCDITMLAFWVWAVLLWLRGAESGGRGFAILSTCLITAAALTKYFALTLVPLLLAWSLLRWPRVRWRVLYLLIPVIVLLVYDSVMRSLYGRSVLFGAGSYALAFGDKSSYLSRGVATLSFSGGCVATLIFYAPLLWSRRVVVVGFLGMWLAICLFSPANGIGNFELPAGSGAGLLLLLRLQFAAFVAAGVGLMALAIADYWRSRDSESALLVLWTAGTFVFCWLCNWTVSGRSVLPIVPAASILIVRRIHERGRACVAHRFHLEFVPLVFVGLLALAVTWADTRLANTARAAAAEIRDRYGGKKSAVKFMGHWGFQYYMESYGFTAVDGKGGIRMVPGDVVILPENNTNVPDRPPRLSLRSKLTFVSFPLLATMHIAVGAGFYGGLHRPLPFAVGPVPAECYYVLTPAMTDNENPRIRQ